MSTRKGYSKEFKEGAVRQVLREGRAVGEVADSLGVSRWSLYTWLKAARTEGKDAFRGQGNRSAAEQEVHELKQRIRVLEEEKAILKKAATFFAKNLG
jgi:transposase